MLANFLFGAFSACALINTFFFFVSEAGRPQRLTCKCPWKAQPKSGPSHHPKPVFMLTACICAAVVAFGFFLLWRYDGNAALAVPLAAHLLSAYVWFSEWRSHTKDKRKKLKDKVLARVKETVAGLKVVPEPVHS